MTYSESREVRIIPMNINFIDNSTGKTILCEKTDIACWWCTYSFETLPCFIPERYNDGKFYVFGCFCSFNCAMSYNILLNDYKVLSRNSLIKNLYYTITGKNDDISLAPPKEALRKYGGILTIDEYRKGDKKISAEYRLKLPPMINLIACIEEKSKEKHYNYSKGQEKGLEVHKKKSLNIMDTVGIKEVLKRKLF